jgi:hypothetical protein
MGREDKYSVYSSRQQSGGCPHNHAAQSPSSSQFQIGLDPCPSPHSTPPQPTPGPGFTLNVGSLLALSFTQQYVSSLTPPSWQPPGSGIPLPQSSTNLAAPFISPSAVRPPFFSTVFGQSLSTVPPNLFAPLEYAFFCFLFP